MKSLALAAVVAAIAWSLLTLGGQAGRWTDRVVGVDTGLLAGYGSVQGSTVIVAGTSASNAPPAFSTEQRKEPDREALRDMREGQGRPGASLLDDALPSVPQRPTTAPPPRDVSPLPDRLIIEVRDQREHPVAPYELWTAVRDAFPPEAHVRALTVPWCESRYQPALNTGNGHYGEWQFNLATWRSVGGVGLPSETSREEQTMRAARLYAERGWQPWACEGTAAQVRTQ